jgi:hypothetical protein
MWGGKGMHREIVISSDIESAGYDNIQAVMEVEWKVGGIGQYKGVPRELAEGIHTAESPGKYMNEKIKGYYEYERVS